MFIATVFNIYIFLNHIALIYNHVYNIRANIHFENSSMHKNFAYTSSKYLTIDKSKHGSIYQYTIYHIYHMYRHTKNKTMRV